MKKVFLGSLVGLITLSLLIPVSSGLAAPAQDDLVILDPHSSEFATHVIDGFKAWYSNKFGTSITVATVEKYSGDCWADVETWNGVNPLADVWWGGGEYYFELARQQDLFER